MTLKEHGGEHIKRFTKPMPNGGTQNVFVMPDGCLVCEIVYVLASHAGHTDKDVMERPNIEESGYRLIDDLFGDL